MNDTILKIMSWNPYESDLIVEVVFQAESTVTYKKPGDLH